MLLQRRNPVLAGAVVMAAALGVGCSSREAPFGAADAIRDNTGSLPVFPGAEGFGTSTVAGRAGRVIRVTTLAKDGHGSLREALLADGPRVVVFEVAGTIELNSNLNITRPFATVAGQTAPSPGITLAGGGLVVMTHDILVQHLRVRVGDRTRVDPENHDALVIGHESGNAYNVVFDHCSFGWAMDEVASTWYPGVRDITISRSIVSEGLSKSRHPKGEHSKGLLVGEHTVRVSVIGNLIAHNMQRNPLVKGNASALIAHNFIYDPGNEAIHLDDPQGAGPAFVTVVGNVVVPGPSSAGDWPAVHISTATSAGTRVFLGDNEAPRRTKDPWSVAQVDVSFDPRASAPPVWVTPLKQRPSSEVAEWVLATAGARPADRDDVDKRIVHEAATRTGRIIDSQEDVGGWPNLTRVSRLLQLPRDPVADSDTDGYTDLEEWLHALAADLEGR